MTAAARAVPTPPSPGQPHRVLLVEDNEVDALLVRRLLHKQGAGRYEVDRAVTLAEALQLLARGSYDVVLLDLCLPDSDGFGTLGGLRRAAPQLPVVVLTWSLEEDESIEAVNLGAEDCLLKGEVNARALARAIRRGVERQRAQSALRELEERLHHSEKLEALGRLAGGVAHDFNNILTAIISYCELHRSGREPGVDPAVYVEHIQDAAVRAAELTSQLLAYSRRQVLAPAVLDLNGVLVRLDDMLRRLIPEDIRIEVAAAPALWPVYADRSQLEQVVLNLAVNARDAMPRGGTLALRTANREVDAAEAAALGLPQGGAWVTLEVRDSGCGMDAATLARIFEPFYTTKPRGVGTGLGLATVQGIVQQSGGHVTASSRPGAGSVFTVYLPKSAGVAEPLVSGGSAPGRPLAGRRVLLAEDDDAVRAPLAACLKLCGCTVVSAARGETALRALDEAEAPFDLLLTDVVMPGMSGAELAAAVVARQPQVRVLFMSGYLEETVLLRGVTSDRAAFLQKPFTLAALEQKLRTAFADAALPAG